MRTSTLRGKPSSENVGVTKYANTRFGDQQDAGVEALDHAESKQRSGPAESLPVLSLSHQQATD